MRIERYALHNFGAWGDVTYEPGDARLCIIVGENGTGKTTLVSEALGHALFKDDRGSVNGGVRNGQTDSAVTVEFTLPDGSSMRAIRRRTTKGAGKSSADLQVRNGTGWIPVAEGDKEVPAAVRELLHMDAATFRTSVSLAQNDLRRFVDATSAKRKEVLAEIVVDPRFAPAAELASKLARDLEARIGADRSHCEQLSTALEDRPGVEERLQGHRADLELNRLNLETQTGTSDRLLDRMRAIDVDLAAADAIAGQVASLEAERTALGEQWRGTQGRKASATTAIAEAERILAGADDVAAAATELPAAQAELERLMAAQKAEAELVEGRRLYVYARGQVDELAAAAAALEPVVCEKCGHANVVDQAGIRPKLDQARRLFRELEAGQGKVRPATHPFDPEALTAAHQRVTRVTAAAARGEAMAAARATLERERAAAAGAEADLLRISGAGTALKARLEDLVAKAAAADPLRAERSRVEAEETRVRSVIAGLERSRTIGVALVAREEAALEQLDRIQAERDELAGSLEAGSLEAGRLRYLAGRFGLKGIPARVIEGVLPELTAYANEVLGELFGLRLELRATRASADGRSTIEALELVVTKDDVGEVELARASGGQGTAIALALALGLSRLNARRAGTAIRSLVIDEPEGLDVIRLKALGAYLRELLHRGELDRAFVITHTTELTEFGDRVDEVIEGPDGAQLRQVA